jgi:hypothetical protein
MFTRNKDTRSRINYELTQLSQNNNYTFATPGNGIDIPFIKDPHIRLQRWGANLNMNAIDIENDLLGKTRTMNRDYIKKHEFSKHAVTPIYNNYKSVSIPNTHSRLDTNLLDEKEIAINNPSALIFQNLPNNPQKHIYFEKPSFTRHRVA